MNWENIPKIEKAFFDSGMDKFFNVEEVYLKRIVHNIELEASRKIETLDKNNHSLLKYHHLLTGVWVLSFYFILGIIGEIFRITFYRKQKYEDSKSKIVLVNAASAINRFDRVTVNILNEFKTAEYFVYNDSFFKHHTKHKHMFLYPRIINIKTILKIFTFLLKYRPKFNSNLINSGINYNQNILKIVDIYIIKQIIHQKWAEQEAGLLYKNNKDSIYFFDQDGEGKALFLTYYLNKRGLNTVHIQHGIMIDARYYIPVSKYMFCSSERERKLLISLGVPDTRLFIYGAPFQTLIQQDKLIDRNDLKVKVLVLAANGPDVPEYVSLIKKSRVLDQLKSKALRLRPGDPEYRKELWKKGLSGYQIRQNSTIFEEIFNAEIIITFSYDALIKCLYIKKKVIACFNKAEIQSSAFSFFNKIDFLYIATDTETLDKHLNTLIQMDQKEYEKSIQEDVLEYNFGTQDRIKIQDNIKRNFSEIIYSKM